MSSTDERELARPVTLTCPACGGSVCRSAMGTMPYFVCHTGHRYAAENMEDAQLGQLRQAFEVALRMLNERLEMCREMAELARAEGDTAGTLGWQEAELQAAERLEIMRQFNELEWLRPAQPDG